MAFKSFLGVAAFAALVALRTVSWAQQRTARATSSLSLVSVNLQAVGLACLACSDSGGGAGSQTPRLFEDRVAFSSGSILMDVGPSQLLEAPTGYGDSSSTLEEGNAQEKAALAALLDKLQAEHSLSKLLTLTVPPGEAYLETTALRFLRARSGDVDKAVRMVHDALLFRERERIDSILSRPLPAAISAHFHRTYDEGWLPEPDRLGRVIYVLGGGRTGENMARFFARPEGLAQGMAWNIEEITEAFLHWHLQTLEYQNKVLYPRFTRRAGGRTVNKMVMVDDLAGLGARGIGYVWKFIGIIKRMTEVDQLLYPENLGTMLFVNAPLAIKAPFQVIRGFFDKRTASKLHVFGSGATSSEELRKVIAANALPLCWGGELAGDHVTSEETPRTPMFDEMHAYIAAQAAAAQAAAREPKQRSSSGEEGANFGDTLLMHSKSSSAPSVNEEGLNSKTCNPDDGSDWRLLTSLALKAGEVREVSMPLPPGAARSRCDVVVAEDGGHDDVDSWRWRWEVMVESYDVVFSVLLRGTQTRAAETKTDSSSLARVGTNGESASDLAVANSAWSVEEETTREAADGKWYGWHDYVIVRESGEKSGICSASASVGPASVELVLRFSNQKSRVRSKSVRYRVWCEHVYS